MNSLADKLKMVSEPEAGKAQELPGCGLTGEITEEGTDSFYYLSQTLASDRFMLLLFVCNNIMKCIVMEKDHRNSSRTII